MDKLLYDKLVDLFPRRHPASRSKLLSQYTLQRALAHSCSGVKHWYSLYDTDYEGLIETNGSVTIPKQFSQEEMIRYFRENGTAFC